ncbi:MAG: aldo/keto reductase [Eubacteriaceae bacterium]|nr:aldo/keto reductase [Eubacteriaceae bacterium]
MQYKQFDGRQLSMLGMGNMRLPRMPGSPSSFHGGAIDYGKAAEIIDYAMASGINYYDTSHIYAGSEEFLGQALSKYPRESYVLCTKYNAMGGQDFEKHFESQLERLKTEYVDVYMFQAVLNDQSADNYLNSGCIEYYQQLKKEGKIRYLGFSSHAPASTLKRFAAAHPWDMAMVQINYFDWAFAGADEQYQILNGLGIPITVMEPLRGGRLASLSEAPSKLLKDFHPDWSFASWALRWLMGLEGVQVILSGMSAMEQIIDNVATFANFSPLSAEEEAVLAEARDLLRGEIVVPCTECDYCLENCPEQLDIPQMMKAYNDLRIHSWAMSAPITNKLREMEKTPADCTACATCLEHCTQAIDIPGIMEELAGRMEQRRRH